MTFLYQALEEKVSEWRESGYRSDSYPAIAEILEYAQLEEGGLRFLRAAQFRSLETYWYLRLEMNTPSVPELYQKLFSSNKERVAAMGISPQLFEEADYDLDNLISRLKSDNQFVRKHHLESLRETYALNYPSYILALAMGAGKTILMGTIAATEFAMAQEYPSEESPFVKNALIFAPGKTIIESLRELADVPYDQILPSRMYGPFAATLKLTFTRDGEKELPVVRGSEWNIVVTNTEKIRIQKPTGKKSNKAQLALHLDNKDEQAEEEANLRLTTIASLPNLAVFSDEAHHTYGQKLLGKWEKDKETGEDVFKEQGIKKVRQTVDFLARETSLKVVVNTTGTPYFERQPLRDVVTWYSLGQGIKDGVLKDVANNIQVFDLEEDDTGALTQRIVSDFVQDYWKVKLRDGSPARLALYFPQTESMEVLKPAVESALAQAGQDVSSILAVHSKSSEETKREFYRVANDPSSPYRIILLVNMGTEGWNCPSLFACGLVRKLKTSNNFVLQAATRCLRQVPGNIQPARIYVSKGNRSVLQKQLEETYGTSIEELNHDVTERIEEEIELLKPDLPPLIIRKKQLRFRRKEKAQSLIFLTLIAPKEIREPKAQLSTWTMVENKQGKVRMQRVDGGEDALELSSTEFSLYGAAAELAANYHLPSQLIYKALASAYGADSRVPEYHLEALGQQIEDQTSDYETWHEEIDTALALTKSDGFQKRLRNGVPVYTARISFSKDRQELYRTADQLPQTDLARERSFHYEGYNFDSAPEADYLERVLGMINQHPDNIEGIWFTGGLTDPKKTELFAEYLGEDNRWHRYTPDFVIARKDGKYLIVEIKGDNLSAALNEDLNRYQRGEAPITTEGRKAVALKRWQELNPDKLTYSVIFAGSTVPQDALDETRQFVAGN